MRTVLGWACAVAVLTSGCATVSIERAKDLSTAGVAYAQAMAAISQAGMEASIDADSAVQIRSMPRAPVSDPVVRDARIVRLAALDDELVKTVVLYATFETSANALEAYFKGLQALAGGSPAAATEESVKQLAGRVNALNAALQSKGSPLSDAKINALGGLAGLVAAQVHGAAVARALERDATVIGTCLSLQEMVLQKAKMDITNNLVEAGNRYYVDRVQAPYARGQMSDGWPAARLNYLKVKALSQNSAAVESAQAASQQMQLVWKRILSGEYSAPELVALLKDTDDLLAAAATLKASNRKDAP